MFSNRYHPWKLLAALAAIAALGIVSARRGDRINPTLWRCIAEPERWNDTRLWVPVARITAVRDAGYEIGVGIPEVRIRVDGPVPGKPGDPVTLTGRFRSDGPRLEAERSRVLPPRFRLRWLAEAISVAVALGVLANFSRHFLFRPRLLQVEGETRG